METTSKREVTPDQKSKSLENLWVKSGGRGTPLQPQTGVKKPKISENAKKEKKVVAVK